MIICSICKQLSMKTKAQLISDALSLAQSKHVKPHIALDLVKFLSKELDYLPWRIFLNRIKFYIDMLESTEVYPDLQLFLGKLVEPYYKKLGWEDDKSQDWLDRLIRNDLFTFACQRNLEDCLKQSSSWFADWMSNDDNLKNIRADIRRNVFCSAIKVGGKKEIDFAFEQLEKKNDSSLRRDLMVGLSCSKELWALSKLLNQQLKDDSLDPILVIRNTALNPIGNAYTWVFVKNNWDNLYNR
jgi:aminopeptidase N